MILAIILVIIQIIFWTGYFTYLSCRFYRVEEGHLYYSFKDGLKINRFIVIRYYIQNIILRIAISVMIGVTSFLTKEQNQNLWVGIACLTLFNCFPLKVFRSTVENINSIVSNGLLLWISFIFAFIQTQPENRLSREYQAQCFIYVYICTIGGLCVVSTLIKAVLFFGRV